MKKRIVLFLLLVSSMNNLQSQSYQRMVETGNRWNYVVDIPVITGVDIYGGQITNSFFLTNDTIIENTKYVKLMRDVIRNGKTETSYVGALREDTINQWVYFQSPWNKENLIYSFNHAVGDTLWVDSLTYDDGNIVRRIKSIDTFDFGGVQRRRLEIYDVYYKTHLGHTTVHNLFSDYWYEGIGSLKMLTDYNSFTPTDGENALLCFWHNNEQVYDNPAYDSCAYDNYQFYEDIKRINNQEDITLFTNPVSGLLRVSCNEPIRKIELLDLDGKQLLSTSTNDLDVSMLADDIYFIRATTVSARMLIERFIKRSR